MPSTLSRLWVWLLAPFGRRFGEKWVEPGNAITRAIAAGLVPETLYIPPEPVAGRPVITPEPGTAVARAVLTSPEPVIPKERKAGRGKPRRAA